MALSLAELSATLKLDASNFNAALKNADKQVKGFSNVIGALNKVVGVAFVGALAAGTAALAKFGASTVQVGAEFQKATAQIAAIKGFRNISDEASEAGQQMAAFEAEARRLGASTAYSATEAAMGMQELARAGLDANAVIKATGPALYLAGASAADMSSATTLLAATMKQFNLSANDASRIADVFTVAQQNSLFAMDSLTEAMKYAGTIGNAFGMSLEETTAAVSLFRDLGVEGSSAGTQFRQALISLANPTGKARKALERYGLTVQDVNPEVKSFEEIMQTLAAANMDMASITALVSKRAAGSIKSISDTFKDGTTNYNKMIQAFREGGGAAEGTYNTMIDNVSGRFDILKSAFQEFQLTVFDTFSEKLKDTIGEGDGGLIGLVNTMTEAFEASSHIFEEAFSEVLGSTLANINENQTEIAATLITTVQRVVELGVAFIKLIPTLITIGKTIAVIFVANKVRLMVAAVVKFAVALKGVGGALAIVRGAMAALVVSSGGILALVAAVATLAAGLGALAASSSKAAASQRRLTESLNASREAAGNFNAAQITAQIKGLSNAAEAFSKLRGSLAEDTTSDQKVLQTLDAQLKSLEELSEKEQRRKVLKGELVQVEIDGEKVLMDYTTALNMAKTEMGATNDIMGQMAQKEEELKNQKERNTEASSAAYAAYKRSKEILADYKAGNESWLVTAHELNQIMADQNIIVRGGGKSMSAMEDAIRQLDNQLTKLQTTSTKSRDIFAGFVGTMEAALAHEAEANKKAQIQRRKDEEKAEAARRGRAREKAKQVAKELESLRKSRMKAEQDLLDAVDKLTAGENQKLGVSLSQKIAKQREMYQKELDMLKRNKKAQLQVEENYFRSIGLLYTQATQAKFDTLNSELDDATQANARFNANQKQQIENNLKDEIQGIRDRTEELNNAAVAAQQAGEEALQKQLDKRLITFKEFDKKMQELFEAQSAEFIRIQTLENDLVEQAEIEAANKRKAISTAAIEEINNARQDILRKGMLEELQIAQEREAQELKQSGATAQVLQAQARLHALQRTQLEEQLTADLIEPYGKYTKEIDDLNAKLAKTSNEKARARFTTEIDYLTQLAALEQKLADVRLQTQGDPTLQAEAVARVQAEIDNLNVAFGKTSNVLDKLKDFGGKAFAAIVKGAGEALRAVVDFAANAGQAIGGAISDGLSFFTGGSATTDIMGLLSQAATAAGEAQAAASEQLAGLEGALASGDITQAEFDEAKAGGLGQIDPAAQAAEFINELIGKAVDFAKAIASQAPLILTELGAQLPILIDVLKEAIPQVVIALGEQLPIVVSALIYGIIDMLPVLADALINQALPNIVTALVDLITNALPRLAGELSTIFSDLLKMLIEAVGQLVGAIVAALPSVVDFLVSAITDILTGIPELIKSLLAAIPVIITELLGGVAEIVSALFNAIPLIINEVILALPNIIKALIEGLLGVLVEIANALPDLIAQIVMLLPVLLEAILELLPQIIIALVEAVPLIIMGLVKGLPQIITALINLIPMLVMTLIKSLPMIAAVLVKSIFTLAIVELPKIVGEIVISLIKGITQGLSTLFDNIGNFLAELPQKLAEAFAFIKELPSMLGEAVMNGLRKLVQFFKDVIQEIVTLGIAETETFGDTPEAIKAGPTGLTANFAPDDYIIAAQQPVELLRQAVGALGEQSSASITSAMARSFPPTMTNETPESGGGSSTTSINIVAEGRLLDSITMTALDRGHAPKLEKKLKRNRGVSVGFSRGRFNKFGAQ